MNRAIAVLLPVLLLAGCTAPDAEDAYLSTVRENIPGLEEVADADLTELAQNVCDTFDDRGFAEGMPLLVEQVTQAGFTAEDAGVIAGSAVGAYCPEYSEEF